MRYFTFVLLATTACLSARPAPEPDGIITTVSEDGTFEGDQIDDPIASEGEVEVPIEDLVCTNPCENAHDAMCHRGRRWDCMRRDNGCLQWEIGDECECVPSFPEAPHFEMCGLQLDNNCNGVVDEMCQRCSSREECVGTLIEQVDETCFEREDGTQYIFLTIENTGSCIGGVCVRIASDHECPGGCDTPQAMKACQATVDWDRDFVTEAEGDCTPRIRGTDCGD